eukprot:gene23212-28091_t
MDEIPETVQNGGKKMYPKYQNVTLMDSYLHLTSPLSKFSKIIDLK